MNREADSEGLDFWLGQLKAGENRMYIFNGFVNSVEWANICLTYGIVSGGAATPTITKEPSEAVVEFSTRMYTTCLNREADQTGRDFWASELSNMRITGTEVAFQFFFSQEFKNLNLDNKEFVARLYETFMGCEPDASGFSFWVTMLNNGATRERVFFSFSTAVNFSNLCVKSGIPA